MYRNCIFCSAPLGANEAVESFPIGSRVAFDAGKGRLWAICPRCARWNLAPIEERWEPVEQAEKLFRGARLRVQSENIGLAQLPDGTRLIHVGEALPGELAAWRYGRQLLRRRNRYLLAGAATGAAVIAVSTLPVIGVIGGGGVTTWGLVTGLRLWNRRKIVYRLPAPVDGSGAVIVRRWHLDGISITADDITNIKVLVRDAHVKIPTVFSAEAWAGDAFRPIWGWAEGERVRPHSRDVVMISGESAHALLRRAMIHINGKGASHGSINSATRLLADSGSADQYVRRVATNGFALGKRAGSRPQAVAGPAALALEMALNEKSERRALEGELGVLEAAWREAEEIASIADSLPDEIRIPRWMRP